ncbi:MAG: hypothetical protein BWZ01_02725 [Deltaproteobacteria bacterium ADurb.BinA179]|nr:MAG: hypothetical protein BWZ01_02725 [Deltaproteobacteria bacterium ADurb.BinA179]
MALAIWRASKLPEPKSGTLFFARALRAGLFWKSVSTASLSSRKLTARSSKTSFLTAMRLSVTSASPMLAVPVVL